MKRKMSLMLIVVMLMAMATTANAGIFSKKKDKSGKVKTKTLKLAFNQSENHPQYKSLADFAKKLETETNGEYKLTISPNALLGDQRAAAELVQTGTIQMAVVANPIVENFNKDFAVIGLPYVYDSQNHQKQVFTSGVLNELFQSTAKSGFRVVGAFTAGSRNIYTDKPITTPEELAGYKIRVMESYTMKSMLDLMGGVGTPMSQSEVYTAVQQGVLDGGENNEVTYADLKHYEIAPYFSYTQHLMVPDLIILNEDIYQGMSPANKEIFNKLMLQTINYEFEKWNENVENSKKIAMANGATFTPIDIKPFQENVKPLQEKVVNSSASTKEIYSKIRALAK